MRNPLVRHLPRGSALTAVAALLVLVAAAPVAAARPSSPPKVDIQHFANLAPDGRAIGTQVIASCPERWIVVEAVVAVSQSNGSGQASFPLSCTGSLSVFNVIVPATAGTFTLHDAADVTASVVVRRGKTQQAADAETLAVTPIIGVDLAHTAQLEPGGDAVTIAVGVACPIGTSGLESRLGIFQGQTSGIGTYVPICDGSPHVFDVRVPASSLTYAAGTAQALTFANVEFEGAAFYGIDDDGALQIIP